MGVLPLCRETTGVYYSPRRIGNYPLVGWLVGWLVFSMLTLIKLLNAEIFFPAFENDMVYMIKI